MQQIQPCARNFVTMHCQKNLICTSQHKSSSLTDLQLHLFCCDCPAAGGLSIEHCSLMAISLLKFNRLFCLNEQFFPMSETKDLEAVLSAVINCVMSL